jgi:hypothetical protein
MLPISLGRRGGAAFCCTSADCFGIGFDMIFYLSVLSVTQKPCGYCIGFLQGNAVAGSTISGFVPALAAAL